MDRLFQAVQMLHGTFRLAHRAWTLYTRLGALQGSLPGFSDLKAALLDSLAQAAVIETYKLYDRKRESGSMRTVMRLLSASGPGLQIPFPDLAAPATVAALKELGKARNEIMAHANYETEQASMRDVPLLLQVAEPFVMATKEQYLREESRVLYRGRQNVPFYEVGVATAAEELQQLIEFANRGRAVGLSDPRSK